MTTNVWRATRRRGELRVAEIIPERVTRAANAALFPLALELFKGQGGEALFRVAAAAALANEQMAVLNANFLGFPVGADDLMERAFVEGAQTHASSTGFPCGVRR